MPANDRYLLKAVAVLPVEAMQYSLMPFSFMMAAPIAAATSLNVLVPPFKSLRYTITLQLMPYFSWANLSKKSHSSIGMAPSLQVMMLALSSKGKKSK